MIEIKKECFDYIEGFYNTRRIHSALDNKSPEEYEKVMPTDCPIFRDDPNLNSLCFFERPLKLCHNIASLPSLATQFSCQFFPKQTYLNYSQKKTHPSYDLNQQNHKDRIFDLKCALLIG